MSSLDRYLGPEVVAAIEALVAKRVERALAEREEQAGRWLTGAKAAAEYLGCSERRVYNRLHLIPHVRDEGRLVFNTSDLDTWLRGR